MPGVSSLSICRSASSGSVDESRELNAASYTTNKIDATEIESYCTHCLKSPHEGPCELRYAAHSE